MVDIRQVDFQNEPQGAVDQINNWINKTTNGKISKLYEAPLDGNTLMVLASSLYFRGSWQHFFEEVNMTKSRETLFKDFCRNSKFFRRFGKDQNVVSKSSFF